MSISLKIVGAFLAFAASSAAFTQTEDKETLLESTYFEHGRQAFSVMATSTGKGVGTLLGTSYGMFATPRLLIGISAQGVVSEMSTEQTVEGVTHKKTFSMYYAGPFAEYELFNYGLFSMNAKLAINGGLIGYKGDFIDANDTAWHSDGILATTPDITALVHITPTLDGGITVGTRVVSGATLPSLEGSTLNGLYYGVTLTREF